MYDNYSDYFFVLEFKIIIDDMLFFYSLMFKEKLGIKGSILKWVLNFNDKENYVFYYCNLNYYLLKGFVLFKIYRVLVFI